MKKVYDYIHKHIHDMHITKSNRLAYSRLGKSSTTVDCIEKLDIVYIVYMYITSVCEFISS